MSALNWRVFLRRTSFYQISTTNRVVSVRVTGTQTRPHDSNFTVSQGSPCELGREPERLYLGLDPPSTLTGLAEEAAARV